MNNIKQPGLLFIVSLFTISMTCCSHQAQFNSFSDSKHELLLIASQSEERLPFTVTLTLRIKKGILAESGQDKLVLFWIERNPDGEYYRAQEEFTVDPKEFDQDLYFYRNYDIDVAGAYTFNVILFPDQPDLKKVSNRVSIRARQLGPVE